MSNWVKNEDKAALPKGAEAELYREWERTKNRKIRDRFIMSVYALACREARKFVNTNVPEDDRIQAAMVGASEAFDHFDPDRGLRFNTYAINWIRLRLLQLVTDERTIVSGSGLCAGRADQEGRRAVMPIYVDAEDQNDTGEGGTARHGAKDASHKLDELVADQPTQPVDFEADERIQRMRDLMIRAPLTEDERWVLQKRWLQKNGEKKTLQELGDTKGFTREWIRQLEKSAFAKIRALAEEDAEEIDYG